MPILDVGDGSTGGTGDIVEFGVNPGDTVVVKNLASSASSITIYTNSLDNAGTTVAANASQTISNAGPFWVQAQSGVATIQVTGGQYGAV